MFSGDQKMYWLVLVLLVVFAVLARNLARSKVGRAFAAVRERDVAAEVIGVSLRCYKLLALTICSFYVGCCGALMYSITGFFDPSRGDHPKSRGCQRLPVWLRGGA
jgi:branched-chain amino acid transport system permease protein